MKTTLALLFMLTAALLAGQPASLHDRPHFYGLIIGASDYTGQKFDLRYCASDAVRLAANLQGCAGPAYGETNTHISLLSTDADRHSVDWPSKENIESAFRGIAAKIRPGDIFFLFFSGHGAGNRLSLTTQFYFLLPDFPDIQAFSEEPAMRAAQAPFTMSSEDLFEWLGTIRTNKKVIINDCAFSGQMIVDYKKTIPDNVAKTNAYPGMYMLTGAQPDGVAFEAASIGGGFMTYCFNTALSGKSLIGSTVISQLNSKPMEFIDINTAFHYTYLLTQEVATQVHGMQVPMIYLSPSSESFDLGFVNDTIKLPGYAGEYFVERYLNVNLLQEPEPTVKSTDRPLNLIIPNGHSRAVSTFDYTPDSLYLLTGSADKTARLWDRARNEIAVYRGHSGAIEEVAFAGGGQRVLTRSSDGTVKLWTLEGREIVSLDKVNDMAVTSDGQFFLTSGNTFNSTLRDLEGKPVGAPLQHPSVVIKVAVSGNGDRFLTYGLDNTAILWDRNGRQITSLEIGGELFRFRYDQQFHISNEGKYIFYGTVYGPGVYHGKVWNSAGEVLIQEDQALFNDTMRMPLSTPFVIGKIALKIDSAEFEIRQTAVYPRYYDLSDETGLTPNAESGSNRTICFSPNGGNPVLFSMGKTAYLWDLTTNIRTPLTGINSNVLSTAVAPDGRSFLTAAEDGRISLWDIDGQRIDSFDVAEKIKKIRFSPDGRRLFTVCADNVSQWTLAGEILHVFELTDSPVIDADVAPDGASILLCGFTEAVLKGATEATVLGWERDSILPDQFGFSAVAVSPDGAAFLTANGVQGTVRLSNLPDPVLKIKLPFSQAAFSADGRYILLGSGSLNLPRLQQDAVQPGVGYLLSRDGRLLHRLKGHTDPNDILLVYLSGHGITYPPNSEKGRFYYLTTDIVTDDLKDPAVRNEKAIAQDSLQQWINQVTARKRILILDACNSGQVVKTMGPGEKALNSDQRRALERMKDRSGMFVLAGSAADKSSFEASRFGHGLLTYSLLNNMPKVAAENKALINVGQLFTEALEEVPKLAKDIGRVQTPELIGAGSFDIGMIKGAPPFAIPQTIPVFLRTNFTNKKAIDSAGLSRAVNKHLEYLAGQKEPALAYWDLVEFAGDHYYLGGSYEQLGETLSGETWLYREGKELTSLKFSGPAAQLDTLAEQIVDQAFQFLNKKK